jgi:phage protein D
MVTDKEAPRIAWGKVPVETDTQLRQRARLTSADVAAAKAWVKSFSKSVLVVDVLRKGTPKRWLTAAIYRQLWEARSF